MTLMNARIAQPIAGFATHTGAICAMLGLALPKVNGSWQCLPPTAAHSVSFDLHQCPGRPARLN